MLTMHWSLLDVFGGPIVTSGVYSFGSGRLTLTGTTKEQVELKLRITFAILGLLLAFVVDFSDTYTPQKRMVEFRRLFLSDRRNTWRESLGDGVRFNVMHARRRWFLPFLRTFVWTWNDGFDPPEHRDAGLCLTEFQGVCGLALRSGEGKFVELPRIDYSALSMRDKWSLCKEFWLLPWQLKKTQNIRAILSVPLFVERKTREARWWKAIGVINIDAVSDEAANRMKPRVIELTQYFIEEGKIVALLG